MSKLVGRIETYVYTGDRGRDMHAWLDGMRAGRAFVTNGPLVQLSVNGKLPGKQSTWLPVAGRWTSRFRCVQSCRCKT